MAVIEQHDVPTLEREEGRRLFDELARETVGMTGLEFVAVWDAGAFDNDPDRPDIMRLVMLLPLAR